MPPKDSTPQPLPEQAQPAPQAGTDLAPLPAPHPPSPRLDRLPQFRVLLHNDEASEMAYVVESICDLTPLAPQRAAAVMLEAHRTGIALILVTHRERAELYVDLFQTRNLTVTMEPAE